MGEIPQLELKTIEEIKRISAKQAVSMKINAEKKPKITDSKFGGVPYWDMRMEYPRRSSGTLLMLLAQINLDELNREGKNPGGLLPKSGMLQFFIDAGDDVYGVNFDKTMDKNGRLVQDGFRVVYHKEIDDKVSTEDIKALGMPVCSDEEMTEGPVWGEYGLDIALEEVFIGTDDYRFWQYLSQAAKTVGLNIDESKNFYRSFSEPGRDFAYDQLDTSGHWMLGYPYFTQADPREAYGGKETLKKAYDVLLFQMDSDYGDGGDDYIMWGDSGVGNFFINSEDLAKEDFRDILYSWDCC